MLPLTLVPSWAAAVMIVCPGALAVTLFESTEATPGLLLVHIYFLFMALEGSTSALNDSTDPTQEMLRPLMCILRT